MAIYTWRRFRVCCGDVGDPLLAHDRQDPPDAPLATAAGNRRWQPPLATAAGNRRWQPPIAIDETIRRVFRVRLRDTDGLRVMTASRYPAFVDFIRWEMIARSPMYHAIVKRGLAPTLGSQKLIYRKPLKVWTRFTVELELAGWDDKWIYHIHRFEQHGEIMAIGITRALIWKRDVQSVLADILREIGSSSSRGAPSWVLSLFAQDKDIVELQRRARV